MIIDISYIFKDAIPSLVKAMEMDLITPYIKNWNQTVGYHNLYNAVADKNMRLQIRETSKAVENVMKSYY